MAQRRATSKGFARTSSLLTQRIRKASESRGFAQSRLLTHWEEVIGADTAAIARPVNVSYGRQGFGATLTILTTGANAPMVEMQKEQIRAKVNAVYGYNAISRVRITQTAPTGFAEGRAVFERAVTPKKPEASDAIKQAAAQSAGGVQSNDLRVALERLAQNVLLKSKT
ncbi:DUF721 domain-containing protein [Planktotalea arctica]|uniref:DUF721 domain-containing protein n=1 Tax=Planktotalea arctica TaxID=1481893 RepID=UPI000A1783A3|nr:DciA family protein [Planktotalea arctica]